MLEASFQSTLDNKYITIWMTITLVIEPTTQLHLGAICTKLPTNRVINLPRLTTSPVTLNSLQLSPESLAKAIILSSLWSQSPPIEEQPSRIPIHSESVLSNIPTTS
jgi:hypothetical protein